MLSEPELFYPIYILSGIWQGVGWSSIIYLATLAGIDQEQYEAARIDGAGGIQQMIHITLPGLLPTVSMLLILDLGKILSVGSDKILLLYQPLTYEVADVISTYVYRKGLESADYSYSTAVGLFNSLVNITFLTISNRISKKLGQSGLFREEHENNEIKKEKAGRFDSRYYYLSDSGYFYCHLLLSHVVCGSSVFY